MNNKIDFSKDRYHALLQTAGFSMILSWLLPVSEFFAAGLWSGETGLSGVQLLIPFFSLFSFLGLLISIGTSFFHTGEQKIHQKESSSCYFSQGLLLSLAMGVVLLLFMTFGENTYFSFLKLSSELRVWTREYFFYTRFLAFLYPLYIYLLFMIYSDGNTFLAILSYIVFLITNLVLSLILGWQMGSVGIGMATLLGNILGLFCLLPHFFRTENTLTFSPYFQAGECLQTLLYSLTDAGLPLCQSLLAFLLNKWVLLQFGESFLPVLAMVLMISRLNILFKCIPQAIFPQVHQYTEEKNLSGIKRLLHMAANTALHSSLLLLILLFLAADRFPIWFCINDYHLSMLTVIAIRIVTLTCPLTALLHLYLSYYGFLHYRKLALTGIILEHFIYPLVCALGLSLAVGYTGLWVGLMLSPVLTLGTIILLIFLFFGEKNFPYMLSEENMPLAYFYNLELIRDQIFDLRDQVEQDLTREKTDRQTITRIMLLIEEGYLTILLHNQNRPVVISEFCVLLYPDKTEVIIKDNGIRFDMLEEAGPLSSLKEFVLMSLMETTKDSQYLPTANFNRHLFYFPVMKPGN